MQSSYPPAMAQFSSMGSVPSSQMPAMSRQMQQISMDSYNVNLVSVNLTICCRCFWKEDRCFFFPQITYQDFKYVVARHRRIPACKFSDTFFHLWSIECRSSYFFKSKGADHKVKLQSSCFHRKFGHRSESSLKSWHFDNTIFIKLDTIPQGS